MNGDLMEVLMYMLERCLDDESQDDADRDAISAELVRAGFPEHDVERAFSWLDGLSEDRDDDWIVAGEPGALSAGHPGLRVYDPQEQAKLDASCQGFLLFLEQSDILDFQARERVIERVMALDTHNVDLEQLKWVVLMVLFNQPGQEQRMPWVEEVVLEGVSGRIH